MAKNSPSFFFLLYPADMDKTGKRLKPNALPLVEEKFCFVGPKQPFGWFFEF
jgi:hypothetical protein